MYGSLVTRVTTICVGVDRECSEKLLGVCQILKSPECV
jgi:hypothetical protein